MFFADNRASGRLLLRNCLLADVRGGELRPGMDILIDEGVVVSVHRGADDPADAQIHDLGGSMVTPGYIDSHVHLCLDSTPDCHLRLDQLTENEQVSVLRQSLKRNLHAGVTSVRDVGSRVGTLSQLAALQASAEVYPTVLASGPVLTVPDGHGMFFGAAVNSHNADAIVSGLVSAGAECVKLIATGGNLSPRTDVHGSQFSDAEFAAIVSVARAHNLYVACHAHGADAIDQGLRHGVQSIEHGSYMREPQLEQLKQHGVYWVPTVCPGRLIGHLSESASDRVDRRRRNIRLGVKVGTPLVAGTDAGIGGAAHGSLAHELDEFTDAGMTRMQALRAGTWDNAIMMGIEDRKGAVAVGYDADLLVFPKSLSDDEFSFHSSVAVIKGGVLVSAPDSFAAGAVVA